FSRKLMRLDSVGQRPRGRGLLRPALINGLDTIAPPLQPDLACDLFASLARAPDLDGEQVNRPQTWPCLARSEKGRAKPSAVESSQLGGAQFGGCLVHGAMI